MINDDVKEYVRDLDIDALTRWYCLIKGIRVVFDKIEELDDDIATSLKNKRFFNRVERSINVYIQEMFPAVKSDIEIDHQKLVDTFDTEQFSN